MIRMAHSESEPIVVEFCNHSLAIIRLNRPAERNALSIATLEALHDAVTKVIASANIKTIIFTGTGNAFASGANIRELAALSTATAKEFALRGQHLFQTIADASQLTIAAINGYCMGGGLDLALCCDFRCASHDAVFAHPGARLGIITGWGGTQRLPRLIGKARAFEMFATAKRLTADEALKIGLAHHVCEPVLACAIELFQNDENNKRSGARN